ncbi:hypothetical protein SeLEV6574_g01176 [Synchytrium endobioticum]|uniref:RRM domain-containing protein n=1 Tax=Synchytrium endobioticum TaxID=286115 RepID=A0A507DF10_9FUNG|nr:hypothetical protein SeLEV6574_g01176 [Synchytrium endobioticum]
MMHPSTSSQPARKITTFILYRPENNPHITNDVATSISVSGVPRDVPLSSLAAIFTSNGCENLTLIRSRQYSKPPPTEWHQGHCIIHFSTPEDAQNAIQLMEGLNIKGTFAISIQPNREPEELFHEAIRGVIDLERTRQPLVKWINPSAHMGDRHVIIVDGLPLKATNSEIRCLFSKYGAITHIRRGTQQSNCYGAFASITYSDAAEAKKAMTEMNGKMYKYRPIGIRLDTRTMAYPKAHRTPSAVSATATNSELGGNAIRKERDEGMDTLKIAMSPPSDMTESLERFRILTDHIYDTRQRLVREIERRIRPHGHLTVCLQKDLTEHYILERNIGVVKIYQEHEVQCIDKLKKGKSTLSAPTAKRMPSEPLDALIAKWESTTDATICMILETHRTAPPPPPPSLARASSRFRVNRGNNNPIKSFRIQDTVVNDPDENERTALMEAFSKRNSSQKWNKEDIDDYTCKDAAPCKNTDAIHEVRGYMLISHPSFVFRYKIKGDDLHRCMGDMGRLVDYEVFF